MSPKLLASKIESLGILTRMVHRLTTVFKGLQAARVLLSKIT